MSNHSVSCPAGVVDARAAGRADPCGDGTHGDVCCERVGKGSRARARGDGGSQQPEVQAWNRSGTGTIPPPFTFFVHNRGGGVRLPHYGERGVSRQVGNAGVADAGAPAGARLERAEAALGGRGRASTANAG